ncbi:MAG TPA: sugar ABC transporter permease, partial [Mycobacteriales bacterium]|nr:sugar ABC transporter permease [Mycobacteriales bacterium]
MHAEPAARPAARSSTVSGQAGQSGVDDPGRAAGGSGRPGSGPTGSGPARSRRRRAVGSRLAPVLFLLPAAVLFVLFLLIPIGYAILLSLHGQRVRGGLLGRRTEVWVGLDNYRAALADPELWHSLVRLVIYGLLVVPIMLGLALAFALMLDVPTARLRRFSRIAIFLPYAVPGVIATMLWGFLYLPGVSPIRYAAEHLNLPPPNFFGVHSIFGAVANVAIWGGVGFNMIVLYTSLRAVPSELYDAARVDGCGEWQIATRIKIPLLVPAIVMTTVFSLIATLQVFNEPMTLRPLTN